MNSKPKTDIFAISLLISFFISFIFALFSHTRPISTGPSALIAARADAPGADVPDFVVTVCAGVIRHHSPPSHRAAPPIG